MAYFPGTPDPDFLTGSSRPDTLDGGDGNDTLQCLSGDDVAWGRTGDDDIHGGNGTDYVSGGEGSDKLWGDAGSDTIYGGDGEDVIRGGTGDDFIIGGARHDSLYGDAGADTFIYLDALDSIHGDADIIFDFEHGIDKINVAALGYTGITTGTASAHQLRIAYSAAADRTYLRDDHSNFEIALKGDYRSTLTADDFRFALPGRVGIYEASAGNGFGEPGYSEPITNLGLEAVRLDGLSGAELSGLKAVFLLNGSNNNYGPELLASLPNLADYVAHGGVLIIQDRYVDQAEKLLFGLDGEEIHRNFQEARDVNFVNDAGAIANGLGGDLDDLSLDKGAYSDHGYAIDSTLPDSVVRVQTTVDPNHVVSFAYAYGAGAVYYSTIPVDYTLSGRGEVIFNQHMMSYAENVISWAVQGHDLLAL